MPKCKHSSEKAVNFLERSFTSYLIFAAGEVNGKTVCGPLIVLPRTIQDSRIFYKLRFNATWLKTRSWIGASTIDAREAKPALKVASTQGRRSRKSWPFYKAGDVQCLGVKKVLTRERGPGHQEGSRGPRGHRHREVHRGKAWWRLEICGERG